MKVIGLSGTIGSGKNEVKEFIKERISCYYVTLSDVLRMEVEKKRGVLNRGNLQNAGNEMRQKYGTHILAMLSIEYLPRDRDLIIVDGIRNPGEGEYLRKKFGSNFVWVGVDAPLEIRYKRAYERQQHNDPRTMEEFAKIDQRDQGTSEPEYGQHTKDCIDRCDYKIVNDGNLEELKTKVNGVLDNVFPSK